MYDLVLKGGTIIDGTRKKPFKADVCIKNKTIAAIVNNFQGESQKVVFVEGKVVCPGFIDIHSHSDICPLLPPPYQAESKLYQGVTTEIVGNCGISIVPNGKKHRKQMSSFLDCSLEIPKGNIAFDMESMSEYTAKITQAGTVCNIGALIGHGTLRGSVMGFEQRDPTNSEMETMKNLLDFELAQGAFGLSLGLIYPPSAYAKQEELKQLSKIVAKHKKILCVHLRSEGEKVFEAVDEMLDIVKFCGVHLHISHLKLMGKPQWYRATELLNKIQTTKGVTVTCDQYPYTATSTSLSALVPQWAHNGGLKNMLKHLATKSKALRREIAQEMERRGGAFCVMISSFHGHMPEMEGKHMAQIAKELHTTPEEAVIEVLIRCHGEATAVFFALCEEDVFSILKSEDIAIASDGYSYSLDTSITNTNPHPRSFGTFPHFLELNRRYSLMPLEDAVYKLTGLPADILGLHDRGVLHIGNKADITVFDPQTVEHQANYKHSVAKPTGILHVLVNGTFALEQNQATQTKAGVVLLKS